MSFIEPGVRVSLNRKIVAVAQHGAIVVHAMAKVIAAELATPDIPQWPLVRRNIYGYSVNTYECVESILIGSN